MSEVLSDHLSSKNVDFLMGFFYVWVYGVTSVERGHLTDQYQNVAKDLSYYQHKYSEPH